MSEHIRTDYPGAIPWNESKQQNLDEIKLAYSSNHDVQWLIQQLSASRASEAALRERYEALRLACHEPVPEGGPITLGGHGCLLCGWDVDPGIPESHEPSCLLFAAASSTSKGDAGRE